MLNGLVYSVWKYVVELLNPSSSSPSYKVKYIASENPNNSLSLSKGCPFLLSLDFETINISAATPTLVADTILSQQKYLTDRSTKAVFFVRIGSYWPWFSKGCGSKHKHSKVYSGSSQFSIVAPILLST